MTDSFSIPGLTLVKDVISLETEQRIIDELDLSSDKWDISFHTRVQEYGLGLKDGKNYLIERMPDLIQEFSCYLTRYDGMVDGDCYPFTHVNAVEFTDPYMITNFMPEEKRSPVFILLNLLNDVIIRFDRIEKEDSKLELPESLMIIIPRRSILIFSNEAKLNYYHSFYENNFIYDQEKKKEPFRRVFLKFRCIL